MTNKNEIDQFEGRAAYWDSPDKESMASDFIREMSKHIQIDSNWKGLEIGAGTGLVGLKLLPSLSALVCIDTSKAMIDVLRQKTTKIENIEIIHGETTTYKKKDINFIFSNMSFHHVENIPALMDHLKDISLPGGWLAIGDLCEEDGSFHGNMEVPHNGFNTDALKKTIESRGFKVQQVVKYRKIVRNANSSDATSFDQFLLVAQREMA